MFRQFEPGECLGREEDAVQPSDESQRTAPPEESAAGHSSRAGEGMATPSHHFPYDRPTLSIR